MIILVGPVGAGKSVQAQILVSEHGFNWISTGELLRESNDESVKEALQAGRLVPDETVKRLLIEAIKNTPAEQDIILDGFPRRISQAEWLDTHKNEVGRAIDHVVYITLDEEEAARRMSLRGRHDDSEMAIHQRNKTFHEQVQPVIEYYKDQGIVHEIDGSKTVEEVARQVRAALNL